MTKTTELSPEQIATTQDMRDRHDFFKDELQRINEERRKPAKAIGVKRVHPDAVIPVKAHATDAGFDLVAVDDVIIEPGETVKVPTGLAFELPEGYEMQIRPRSGVTLRTKLRVQLGTVDCGFTGEVSVIVDNIAFDIRPVTDKLNVLEGDQRTHPTNMFPQNTYLIRKGDRIAQAVIQCLPDVVLTEVSELGESERGEGGFGSSGV